MSRFSVLIIAGLLVSMSLTGLGVFVNDLAGNYGTSTTDLGALNKTAEFEAELNQTRSKILDSDVDSVAQIFWAGFTAAPSVFKGFYSVLDIFTTMLQTFSNIVGLPTWVITTVMLVMLAIFTFTILRLFIKDRI